MMNKDITLRTNKSLNTFSINHENKNNKKKDDLIIQRDYNVDYLEDIKYQVKIISKGGSLNYLDFMSLACSLILNEE